MKWRGPRQVVIGLAVLLLLTVSLEQVVTLPVLSLLLLIRQQLLLSDGESVVLAGWFAVLVAVAVQLPLAISLGGTLAVTWLARRPPGQLSATLRDALLLTLWLVMIRLAVGQPGSLPEVIGYLLYVTVVVLGMRVWSSRNIFRHHRSRRVG